MMNKPIKITWETYLSHRELALFGYEIAFREVIKTESIHGSEFAIEAIKRFVNNQDILEDLFYRTFALYAKTYNVEIIGEKDEQ